MATTRDESKIQVDVTLYGATGFVGKHVARYLIAAAAASNQKDPLRLTLAGRNRHRLEERKDSLTTTSDVTLDVIVADSSDTVALKAMAERTRVIINCAGPFINYGNNVVAACAEVGTDYVDITGEITWAGQMRATFGFQAKKSGARCISLCGFDSIPSDISIFAAVQALRKAKGDSVQIESGCTWHSVLGMANGGTLHSALEFPLDINHCLRVKNGDKTSFRKVPFLVDDPLVLANPSLVRYNPEYDDFRDGFAAAEWKNQFPSIDSNFGSGMSLAFFMAPVNAKVIAASAAALQYGPNFVYRERFLPLGYKWTRTLGLFSILPGLIFQFVLFVSMGIFMIPILGKKLADVLLPPGSGVPDSLLDSCYADVYAEVTAAHSSTENATDSVDRASCFISFEGDPGNLVTAQCVSEAALCLVYNRNELPSRSEDGFGTPAELLGPVLLKRLEESKVRKVKIVTRVHLNSPKHKTQVYM
jgi:short subunit dehydrogenase-like uncharacterized protein